MFNHSKGRNKLAWTQFLPYPVVKKCLQVSSVSPAIITVILVSKDIFKVTRTVGLNYNLQRGSMQEAGLCKLQCVAAVGILSIL